MTLSSVIESGLNEAGTAVAVIAHPERGAGAVIDYVNKPFAAVLRRLPSDLIGGPIQIVLDLVANAKSRDRLLQALQSGTPVELDLPLLTAVPECWLGLRLSFPPPAASGARNAILIGRDITAARKQATQEEKMRQLLAQIFMRINAPVTIVGRNGELVMCNTAFRQLTGFSTEELKHVRVKDLTPPEYVEAVTKAREAQFVDGERYEIDFETLVKGGERVAVRLTSMLLSENDQEYRVVTLIPRLAPIQDRKPIEAAARTAAVQAYASRDRGELQAVSLDALREQFGADWERIALRAMLRAEQAIRKRLEPEDIVSRLDGSNFALWFHREDHPRNTSTLQAIVRDIRRIFLTEFGEEVSSHVNASLVPGDPALHPGSPPPTEDAKAKPTPTLRVWQTPSSKAAAG